MSKALWAGYALLTMVKLFTAKVGALADPTVKLVLKTYPTLGNSFSMPGEENAANMAKYQGTWYYDGRYTTLLADEHGFPGEFLYTLLIACWWFFTILIAASLIKRLLMRKKTNTGV